MIMMRLYPGPAIRSIWISLYAASRPGSDGGSEGLLKIIGNAGAFEIEYLAENFGKFGVGGLFLSPTGVASLLFMCKPRVNTR